MLLAVLFAPLPGFTAAAPHSREISISCYRLRTELRCLVGFQVGDAMDSDVSGVSVPLEHSFEVGESVTRLFSYRVSANSLLLTLAPRLAAASTAPSTDQLQLHTCRFGAYQKNSCAARTFRFQQFYILSDILSIYIVSTQIGSAHFRLQMKQMGSLQSSFPVVLSPLSSSALPSFFR